MSPWWRETITAQLAPAEVSLTRRGRGPRRRELARRTLTAAESAGWREIVATMSAFLEASRWRNADLRVTLRGSFVRYLVLPWIDDLAERDALAYAQQSFAELHGEAARGWAVCLSAAMKGKPRVAGAVDAQLIDELRFQCAKLGLRLRSVRPGLCAAIEDLARVDAAYTGWLALIEARHTCVARLQHGDCLSVRSARFAQSPEEHLLAQLEQDALCAGTEEATRKLYVHAAAPLDDGSLSERGWSAAPLPALSLA